LNGTLNNASLYEHKSLSQLRTISRYKALHPDQKNTCAWQGLEALPQQTHSTAVTLDLSKAPELTKALNQARVKAVQDVLIDAPFVVLTGISGVGKTSFVTNLWSKHSASLHIGEEQMRAWAQDRTPGLKTLFIDEANLNARDWSEFEGLFNTPPGLLIANQYVELSTEHKVIFAGNPLVYGGERHVPSLMKRHGNSVLFHPLPPEYLYQEILRPILSSLPPKTALPILEVAAYLTQCSRNEVLISPRDLTSMALFTRAYCLKYPNAQALTVAQHYAFTLGYDLAPDAFKQEFKYRFPPQFDLVMQHSTVTPDFIMTPSHHKANAALDDFLQLRRLQQSGQNGIFQDYKGLGGLIIEGEPGHGKTRLVNEKLCAWDFKKGNPQEDNQGQNVFYDIPVSMPLTEKRALLLKAFHEGAVVLIDEINSSSFMERLMNDLLMARDPEGLPAQTQGFLLIGTQNPVSMAGRAKASTALQRRMQKISIHQYTAAELTQILSLKNLSTLVIKDMVAEYIDQSISSDQEANRLKTCPRTLFKEADKLVRLKQSEAMELEEDVEKAPSYTGLVSMHGVFKRSRENNDDDAERVYQIKQSKWA
jgi:MoxR-like ATPase